MEISLIANTTWEGDEEQSITKSAEIFAGKNAGICYMADDYFSEKANNINDCLKRAERTAKSGHYSVYGHYHLTFLLKGVSKAVAMVLNNIATYNTSEKSARYTKMEPETDLEKELYKKWQSKFEELIKAYGEENYVKLAQENARYMISVFTPTTMSYTIPYNRLLLLFHWIDQFDFDIRDYGNKAKVDEYSYSYFKRLAAELMILKSAFINAIGFSDTENVDLEEHKDMYLDLFYNIRPREFNTYSSNSIDELKSHYGDVYLSTYKASFACVAQLQRHRTTKIKIQIDKHKRDFYIPALIKNTILEKEWFNDMTSLIKEGIHPQGLLVDVVETGRFEDFVLKCKERLCSRAQYEAMDVTRNQVKKFIFFAEKNLDYYNQKLLKDITNIELEHMNASYKLNSEVKPRCCFDNYTCKEPCKLGKNGLCRNF